MTLPAKQRPHTRSQPQRPLIRRVFARLLPKHDPRSRLPTLLSRFLGFRPPNSTNKTGPPFLPFPIPPFNFLNHLPLQYESWLFATIGSFVVILLVEVITSTPTAFQSDYHSPLIIVSFGASAVLLFGVPESSLAQPRNLIIGHMMSAIIAIAITRLWLITNPGYTDHLNNQYFYAPSFVNGALCMSLALLGQMVLRSVHPPGGATALAAATDPTVVALSWHYLSVVLASALLMLGWALLWNNLGRKRYPVYWLSPRSMTRVEKEQAVDEEMGKEWNENEEVGS